MNKRKHTGAKSVKFYDIFKTLRRSEQQSDTHNKNVLTGAAAHVQSLMGPPVQSVWSTPPSPRVRGSWRLIPNGGLNHSPSQLILSGYFVFPFEIWPENLAAYPQMAA